MTLFDDLIGKGYFPKELPPPFTTQSLAVALSPGIPNHFNNKKWCGSITYNLARPASLRRKLTLVHPLPQVRLSKLISDNWPVLTTHIGKSTISQSSPVHAPTSQRALSGKSSLSQRPKHRAKNWAGARYVLQTDIASFYPTIYTHSISWALHTKPAAKQQIKKASLLGNKIDKAVQQGQDGQTKGIPIGPDTSLVVAEVLLAAVDEELGKKTVLKGHRYIDDLELSFRTLEEAETALAAIQTELAEFELQLNPKKVDIIKLPSPVDDLWTSRLRSMSISNAKYGQKQQYEIRAYLAEAATLARENPARAVLGYALSTISRKRLSQESWDFVEGLLLQYMSAEPGTIEYMLEIYSKAKHQGFLIDYGALAETMADTICWHLPIGHSSEASWALWTLLVFKLTVPQRAVDVLCTTTDSVVGLLALHAQDVGLIPAAVTFTNLKSLVSTDQLYGHGWLVSYEAGRRGWLPPVAPGDHIGRDPLFSWMRTQTVSFYDTNTLNQIWLNQARPVRSRVVTVMGGY